MINTKQLYNIQNENKDIKKSMHYTSSNTFRKKKKNYSITGISKQDIFYHYTKVQKIEWVPKIIIIIFTMDPKCTVIEYLICKPKTNITQDRMSQRDHHKKVVLELEVDYSKY